MIKIFFDTEFTGLHQDTTLISIGCVSDNDKTFYAEFDDYDRSQMTDWLERNVVPKLSKPKYSRINDNVKMYGSKKQIASEIKNWLYSITDKTGEQLEFWGDCLHYDWILFCELYGGSQYIPSNVYYIPFDISTMMKVKGIDPDIKREIFSNVNNNKHNALADALMIKKCYYNAEIIIK